MNAAMTPLFSASISVTNRCNLRCQYCYAAAKRKTPGEELTTREIFDLIDKLDVLGCFNVQLTGGEPFLRPDFLKICEYASKKGMALYVISNGTLLKKSHIKALGKLNLKSFQISMDAASGKVYEELRGKDFIDRVMKTLRTIPRSLRKKMAISCVIVRKNTGELEKLSKLAKKLGVSFALIPIILTGKARGLGRKDLKFEEKVSEINKLFRSHGTDGSRFQPIVPPALYPDEYHRKGLIFKYCSFPYHLGITATGDVFPCDGFRNISKFKLGNIRKRAISAIYASSKARRIRKESGELTGVCSRCKLEKTCRGGCRAAAYLAYNNLRAPDPFCQKAFETGAFPKKYLA